MISGEIVCNEIFLKLKYYFVRSVLLQLEYGNKISILGGDYLLANASTGLAALRIPKIVEIVSIAIAEFTQSEFLGQQDPQVDN